MGYIECRKAVISGVVELPSAVRLVRQVHAVSTCHVTGIRNLDPEGFAHYDQAKIAVDDRFVSC
ncbi:MAG TPA: hypothetical protein VF389_03130, partial [Woeseiaceae bacterium]